MYPAELVYSRPSSSPPCLLARRRDKSPPLLLFRLTYYLVPFTVALITFFLYEGWPVLGRQMPAGRTGQTLSLIEPAFRAIRPLAATIFGSGLWMSISSLLPL